MSQTQQKRQKQNQHQSQSTSQAGAQARPLKMRIYTRYLPENIKLPNDLTNYKKFPLWMPPLIISTMLKDKIFGGPRP